MAKPHESKSEPSKVEQMPIEVHSFESDAAHSLERIADALERIANHVVPRSVGGAVLGLRGLKSCPKGHAMQPTDDYCQACERDRRGPKVSPSDDAA
jgi:hypothetical protein